MTLDGQIVRMRFRNCRMGFLDIRLYGHENGCSCCAKITVVVKADVLPSGTIDSYKKGRLRLGDVIRVGGELGLADTATGWIDNGLLEARLLATAEAIVLSRFSGRGFNPELPVQKHSESLLEHQEPTDNPNTADIHRMCKYWINSNGKCPLALFCKFIHPPIETIPTLRIEWLAIRHSARLEASTADWVDPIPMLLKSPHSMRGKVFAEWILNTFSGSGTLDRIADIAGGAGILAMGLREAGVSGSLTVVDSRPLRIGASLKRWMKRAKKHRVPDASSSGKAQDISTLDSEALARSTLPFSYVQTYFSVNSIPKEVSEATFLVGMHPDQATGAIVDVAFQMNLPFAVVPCCVFKDDFKDRKLQNGKPVATTIDLVEWIKEKDPGRIQTEFLNFQGKNLVVFRK